MNGQVSGSVSEKLCGNCHWLGCSISLTLWAGPLPTPCDAAGELVAAGEAAGAAADGDADGVAGAGTSTSAIAEPSIEPSISPRARAGKIALLKHTIRARRIRANRLLVMQKMADVSSRATATAASVRNWRKSV